MAPASARDRNGKGTGSGKGVPLLGVSACCAVLFVASHGTGSDGNKYCIGSCCNCYWDGEHHPAPSIPLLLLLLRPGRPSAVAAPGGIPAMQAPMRPRPYSARAATAHTPMHATRDRPTRARAGRRPRAWPPMPGRPHFLNSIFDGSCCRTRRRCRAKSRLRKREATQGRGREAGQNA